MKTHKCQYTCEEAMLTTMDQPLDIVVPLSDSCSFQ